MMKQLEKEFEAEQKPQNDNLSSKPILKPVTSNTKDIKKQKFILSRNSKFGFAVYSDQPIIGKQIYYTVGPIIDLSELDCGSEALASDSYLSCYSICLSQSFSNYLKSQGIEVKDYGTAAYIWNKNYGCGDVECIFSKSEAFNKRRELIAAWRKNGFEVKEINQ